MHTQLFLQLKSKRGTVYFGNERLVNNRFNSMNIAYPTFKPHSENK